MVSSEYSLLTTPPLTRESTAMNGQKHSYPSQGVRPSNPRYVDPPRIVNTAKTHRCSGFADRFPLPTRIEKFTVNRSPHVDKKKPRTIRDAHPNKRLLDIVDPTPQTVDGFDEARLGRRCRRRDQALGFWIYVPRLADRKKQEARRCAPEVIAQKGRDDADLYRGPANISQ